VPYEYVEDAVTSDVTFRAWGPDLATVFTAAADATTAIMVEDLATIEPRVSVPVELSAAALDLLLLAFLDEVVFQKDARRLLLRPAGVRISATLAGHALTAALAGEPIDPGRHALATDVKAVTLHGLRVLPTATGWYAEVTLDV